jgi:hypothetical protein
VAASGKKDVLFYKNSLNNLLVRIIYQAISLVEEGLKQFFAS